MSNGREGGGLGRELVGGRISGREVSGDGEVVGGGGLGRRNE